MSTDLFYTQLIAQRFSSGKNLTGVADGAASKSLRHPQSRDALQSNDQGFLKTLERFIDNRKPARESKPSDRNKTPVAGESSPDSGHKSDMADCLNKTDNVVSANSYTQVENNVASGGQHINSTNLSLFDLLKQLGIELLSDGYDRLDQLTAQGENAESGGVLESETTVSNKLSSNDLARLEKLLGVLHADSNSNLSDENRRLIQLIGFLSGNEHLSSTKDSVSGNIFQNAAGKTQGFVTPAENLMEALKNLLNTQPINEKTTLADLLIKIPAQLSQLSTPSQNAVSAAGKINVSGDTTDGDNRLLARLEADWALKAMIGGKSTKIQNLTEIIRLNSNPNQIPAQETGQNVQRHVPKNDLHGNPVFKNESTPSMLTHPSPVNNESHAQTVKMTNINPSLASADKVVAKIFTAESDAKDGGFLFNQSQNEAKTTETKLVTPKTEIFPKDFHNQTVNQIVQKAILLLNRGQHEVRLDLKPDYLGHIRMQIITESHQVTVRILTEYPMVKELIENSLPQLKSELQNHGLEIDELDVSLTEDADQHVADRKMADQTKTKRAAENDDQSEDSLSKDAAANIARSIRNHCSTRIDFFA